MSVMILSVTTDEYQRRATPPARFLEAMGEDYVICLKRNCGLPMIMDPMIFSQTRTMVAEWRRHNREPVPLRLLKLMLRCLNGHVELWHALPATSPEQAEALAKAEEAAATPEPTRRFCTQCGESFKGSRFQRHCPDCKADPS